MEPIPEHPVWGPTFSHYTKTCQSRLQAAFVHPLLDKLPRNTEGDLMMYGLNSATLLRMELAFREHLEELQEPRLESISGPSFIEDGTLSHRDAEFLIELLWKSRSCIIRLRSEYLLSGLTILIIILAQLTATRASQVVQTLDTQWLRIQDISLRCYLGCLILPEAYQAPEERYIHDRINRHIFELSSNLDVSLTYDVWFPNDETDALTIVEMYRNLLGPYPDTPLILSCILMRWVYFSLRNPKVRRPAFDRLMPRVLPIALEILQKEFDKDLASPITGAIRETIRLVAHNAFQQIGMFITVQPRPTPAVREAIFEGLLQSDLYGVIGRLMMLITRESGKPLNL
ncbi:unnamed protein product [Rhizoctonia solani]|nr:unnamed protein product [Rhizoctonia solani]